MISLQLVLVGVSSLATRARGLFCFEKRSALGTIKADITYESQ